MPQSEISFASLLYILTRRWKQVVGFSLLVLLVVYGAASFFLEDAYTASVKVLVSKSKVSERMMPGETSYELDTYLHLLRSRDNLAKAMQTFSLEEPPYAYTLESFERCVEVRPLRNTDLLELQVTLPDPELAQKAVNFLAEESIQSNFQLLLQEAAQSRKFFLEEVDMARRELQRTADELSMFMKQAETQASEDYITSSQEGLWKMKQDRAFNVALRDESAAKIEILTEILAGEAPSRVLQRTISYEQDLLQVSEQRAESLDLESLLSLRLESESVNYAYDKAKAELIDASKDYFGAIGHVEAMQKEIEEVEEQIRTAEMELAQKMLLEEELKIASFAFEDIKKLHEKTLSTIAGERQDLVIVERAVLPEKPSAPNRPLLALSAAVFAFLGALFLSLAIDLYAHMEPPSSRSSSGG